MSNPTDTNQASEDELRDAILTEFKQVYKLAGSGDYTENCTNVVMSIIRTEKLKLLAEVRERVIGEDVELNSFEIPMYEEEFVITSVTQQNNLRADQRISLAKLEANQ